MTGEAGIIWPLMGGFALASSIIAPGPMVAAGLAGSLLADSPGPARQREAAGSAYPNSEVMTLFN